MADVKISELSAAGAITGAEQIELVQGGGSVRSTVDGIRNGAVKVYRALLTQTGTDAPVATVLENTLGATPVWSYNDVGNYSLTLVSAFPPAKAFVSTPTFTVGAGFAPGDGLYLVNVLSVTNDAIQIVAYINAAAANGILSGHPIEILVYP